MTSGLHEFNLASRRAEEAGLFNSILCLIPKETSKKFCFWFVFRCSGEEISSRSMASICSGSTRYFESTIGEGVHFLLEKWYDTLQCNQQDPPRSRFKGTLCFDSIGWSSSSDSIWDFIRVIFFHLRLWRTTRIWTESINFHQLINISRMFGIFLWLYNSWGFLDLKLLISKR